MTCLWQVHLLLQQKYVHNKRGCLEELLADKPCKCLIVIKVQAEVRGLQNPQQCLTEHLESIMPCPLVISYKGMPMSTNARQMPEGTTRHR